MLVIQKLIFARTDQCFEHLHAKMINILGVFKIIEVFPILCLIRRCAFDDLFSFLRETSLHSFINNIK